MLACCGVNVVTLTLCIVAISCGAYPETLDGVEDATSDPTELPSDGAAEADAPASCVTVVVEFVNADTIRVRVPAVSGVVTVVEGALTVAVGVLTVAVGALTVAVGALTVTVGALTVTVGVLTVAVGTVTVAVGVVIVETTVGTETVDAIAIPPPELGFMTAT